MKKFKSIFPIKLTKEQEQALLNGKVPFSKEQWKAIANLVKRVNK